MNPSKRQKKEDPDIKRALDFRRKLKSDEEILAKVKLLGEKEKQAKAKKVELKDLNIPGVSKEVRDLSSAEVVEEIEAVAFSIAEEIMKGNGFTYAIPSRTSNNQLYVKELDRLVLKDKISLRPFGRTATVRKAAIMTRVLQLVHQLCRKRIHVTKRDLFYTDVKLFVEQKDTDAILDDAATMLACTRSSLNVVASEKGVVVGRLSFVEDGDNIDCTRMGIGGKGIPPHIDRVVNFESDALFILLVEKDAAFMRLAEDRFYNRFPCIIITAKGQPDVATRQFLKKLKEHLKIPVLGLFDSDPYGLQILSVYMSGSKNMSYDSANLTTPDIKWLGVRPSDMDRYHFPEQCRLAMTDKDMEIGKAMMNEAVFKSNPEWYKELEMMVASKVKAEIQALSSFGFQYLSEVYLPLKLQEGGWI